MQRVARRTEYPYIFRPSGILQSSASTIPPGVWLVGYVENAAFTASLAGTRCVWIGSVEPDESIVRISFFLGAGSIDRLLLRPAAVKFTN